MRGNSHVQCGAGEKVEIISKPYLLRFIALACEKALVTREVLCDMCPIEYYASFDIWLSQIAHAIPVWTTFYRGNPNEKQLATLQRLKEEALYNGNL